MSSTLHTVSNLTGDVPASNSPSPLSSLTSSYGRMLASASNATWSLNPSPRDLLLAIPRMVAQAGSFAINHMPGRVDNLLRPGNAGSVIAEATGNNMERVASAALLGISSAQGTAAAGAATAEMTQPEHGLLSQSFGFQQLRNFGGIFSYMISKWALTCFALVSLKTRCFNLDCLLHHDN